MPQLPSELDYGARPGLGINRLDRPSGAGTLLADDALQAATLFRGVLEDKREKQDKLNYALARNELSQMDLEERSKLADDLDWATHDQRFSDAFTKGRDAISERYNLTGHDMAILDSEANLIHAQGRVQIAGRARQLEVGEAVGRYESGKAKARETIILADPGTRNRMVIGQLEAIDAQEIEGYMTPEEAVAEREDVTQDFALASLANMPADERYRVIKESLLHRDGYNSDKETKGKFDSGAGALTPEDIRNGLGTGSIADFLHADTAAKMLEIAGKEDKTNRQRTESQSIVNRAYDLFPESSAKRMKWINDNSEGSVQNLAEEDARQRNSDEKAAKAEASTERYEDYSQQMESEGMRFKDIPAEELAEMESRHIDALKLRSKNLSYDEQWPAVTQYRDPNDGRMSMAEWNDMSNYGKGGKTDQNLETPLFFNSFTQSDWNALKAEQDNLRGLEGSRITTGELNPRQMVNNALNVMQFRVDDDKGDEKLNGIKARLEGELRRQILQQQNSTTPPKEIDETAKNKILAEILSPYAFTDTDFFSSDYDIEEATPVWLMTSAQRELAYIDLDKANLQTMLVDGIELNVEQVIRKMGVDAQPRITEPSDHNLRRAAFAFINRIGGDSEANTAEVLRRLRGD